MRNRLEIQERFLKESPEMRLGHLASDLARIASFMEMQIRVEAVKDVMEESKFFAEWAARDVKPEVQIFLAEIQSFIAKKELELDSLSNNQKWKKEVSEYVRACSDGLLKKAGFIDVDERS